LRCGPVCKIIRGDIPRMAHTTININQPLNHVHIMIFGICIIVSFLVFLILIFSLIKHPQFRNKSVIKSRRKQLLEIIWATVPFIFLIGMIVPVVLVAKQDAAPVSCYDAQKNLINK
ncbi:MAG: cytochrome c oxidase subunit II transmembrane domain-containing protein, partial [Gammaproteobacteria bacterium]